VADGELTEPADGSRRLGVLLAMAMFVLVVDTSLMNVSISSVVKDLDTTVSGVQAAIALEALVSAAFILLSSKIGDLIGRKRAYVIGLCGYALGAAAMTLAQDLTAIIVFWAICGGLGASLLLPAMQSLIHGNFDGAARKKTYALVGASAAIAAAVGPLLGGFVTTYLSWRVGFMLELVVIAVVLTNIGLVKDVPYTGPRKLDIGGALLSVIGMGGVVLGILAWQEGAEYVGAIIAVGLAGLAAFAYWLVRRRREGKVTVLDPGLFSFPNFRIGVTQQGLQQVTLGGAMIALPIFLQISLEYNALEAGLSLAPLSLTMFAVALIAGRRAGKRRPSHIVRLGFALSTAGMALIIPIVPRADSGWALAIPLIIAGAGLGLLVSQLNNYTLAPIEEERSSEAAGVNSAAGSFGLSFGLAMAGGIMLAVLSLSFTNLAKSSDVIPPPAQQQIADKLEKDAQVVSTTQLDGLLKTQPEPVREELLRINDQATERSLQFALLVPLLASLLGIFNGFRMARLPDVPISAAAEESLVG
jgi:MFS family permease